MSGRDPESEDRVKRFVDGFMTAVPHLAALGIRYRAHGDRWAELELPYGPHLIAFPETGVIASGAIFSLMDSASGFSVFASMGRMTPHATLDLRCDYLRPATPGETVIGRAECFKMTRQVAFVRGVAHDGDPSRPVAHVTGTFMFTAAP
jgi:uncharacterized protein (TIGR00369 family)